MGDEQHGPQPVGLSLHWFVTCAWPSAYVYRDRHVENNNSSCISLFPQSSLIKVKCNVYFVYFVTYSCMIMFVNCAANSIYYGSAGEALLFSQLSKVGSNNITHWRGLAEESLNGVLLTNLSKFGANSGSSARLLICPKDTVLPLSHTNIIFPAQSGFVT